MASEDPAFLFALFVSSWFFLFRVNAILIKCVFLPETCRNAKMPAFDYTSQQYRARKQAADPHATDCLRTRRCTSQYERRKT